MPQIRAMGDNMKAGRIGNASPAKISVLLTADEAVRFETYCEKRGHKKSTLIARLVREHLDREHFAMQAELSCDEGTRGKGS